MRFRERYNCRHYRNRNLIKTYEMRGKTQRTIERKKNKNTRAKRWKTNEQKNKQKVSLIPFDFPSQRTRAHYITCLHSFIFIGLLLTSKFYWQENLSQLE